METWLSWGLVLAIAGAAYFYYSQKDQRVQTRGRSTVPKAPVPWADTETKPKAATKNTKAKKANKAAEKPVKSVKNAVQDVGKNVEAYLSTAGADADDDLTPATSPSLGAGQNPSGKNVSDMLEPQAIRQILKIGATDKQARPAKPQQQRSETQEKTKKQRQNEKKKEEAKVAREAAEAERKKLAEQQRRTAREARGEPARNGLQSAQAPTSNPWSRPAAQAAPATAAAATPVGGQLLDTIDNVSTASSSEAATNGTAPTPDSTSYSNLPSEEDQLRLALEDSAWTTVPKGKKAKKAKNIDEGSDSGASVEPAPAPVKAAKPVAAPVKKPENIKPASRFEVLSPPVAEASHPMDSDWPVV